MKINTTYFTLKERHIYASSRVGVRNSELDVLPLPDINVIFPYSNVISEMREDFRMAQDYSPFTSTTLLDSVRPLRLVGVTLDGSSFVVSEGYRYGFQGQEMEDEVKGNSVNYSFRMHDPRLGRFFAIDPLASKYPFYSPYHFSSNSPIISIELEGKESSTNLSFAEKLSLIVTGFVTGSVATEMSGPLGSTLVPEILQDKYRGEAGGTAIGLVTALPTIIYWTVSVATQSSAVNAVVGVGIGTALGAATYGVIKLVFVVKAHQVKKRIRAH
ncbi:MAG: hypothetical protein E6Q37_03405 [Crocinitomicaceae bacterium]|nr:MAG: hypothetical protein E6Q37_03405 [Crocinitomicaceae bacterium]